MNHNKYIWNLILLVIILPTSYCFSQYIQTIEISSYQAKDTIGKKTFYMDYASAFIKNSNEWIYEENKEVIQVDLIFTKYPFHKKDWITNYDSLLRDRIYQLALLEPSILSDNVKWNFILQTNCTSEVEAKKMFHGAVFSYKRKHNNISEITSPQYSSLASDNSKLIVKKKTEASLDEILSGSYTFEDSIVFNVLNRNPQWKNLLVVNDWTSSMYEYGSQVLLWHKSIENNKRIKSLVFFNDGNRKKIKEIGNTGGIYFVKPDNFNKVVRIMKKVKNNGTGGERAENDLEAILKGIEKVKDFGEIILIADSKSPVRDLSLLSKLKVPVRIILCGSKENNPILHDYLKIALKTGGSIHTMYEDIYNLDKIEEGTRVTIQNIDYIRYQGRIIKAKPKQLSLAGKASL